ncbi:glycerol-3-phosphate dehydrogenase/oxidase [Alicyclobacillus vulcanalis]|uniref:Aerobic glycerol-3-phosphate dehydrogenase n=1 Tax=Alicyclobacillus vulcanalis TaxID=252246 RepID=A0A1N7MCK8_9BACL|nr:FAD-dependent oxidoreductase [Alicyclobacillus vulcanalis]SIS83778.1 homodimeric glycerol 3-phosphate dehydrogenase (quinone) [Alicyclobacillus vulcanalis]
MGHGRFSVAARSALKAEMAGEPFDLLIIGGGITGAGILLDATARGMKAALVEMQDFAAGTSNRSTKLVHGGLRYLKQFEVGLVAEVGKERAIVYENGPHITTPVWMLLPIIEGGTYGRLATSIGIYVYDKLAGVKRSERRKMLSAEQALQIEPLLRKEGLKGAGYYVEYRTDDARLTLEILKKAVEMGGIALNYAKATGFVYDHGRIAGAEVEDVLSHDTFVVRAKKVVNAAGPWVDELREKDGSKSGKTLHHTKGVHIVVDGKRFPLHNSVYFDVPDGRMVFAIPRDGKTYIGTTDTNYRGDLVHPRMTKADRDYLIDCVNFMFPSVNLTAADIESSWAGVRPLIHEEGKDPSEISRKDEVFVSPSGLLTIAGGKLTGYRKMAEKVVDMVALDLAEAGRRFAPCSTDRIPYSGGDFGGSGHMPAFIEERVSRGVKLGLPEEAARRLARRYGTNVDLVFNILASGRDRAAKYGLEPDVFAELEYGLRHEMVVTPSDFFIRRTGALYFDIDWVRTHKDAVIRYMADACEWSEERRNQVARELEDRIVEATCPEDEVAPSGSVVGA